MKTLFVSLFAVLFFVGQTFAISSNAGVEDAVALVTKELKLSGTQTPAVKSILEKFAPKFADLSKSSLAKSALSGDAETKLFGELKTSLGKVLNISQLAQLDGLQQKIVALLGGAKF